MDLAEKLLPHPVLGPPSILKVLIYNWFTLGAFEKELCGRTRKTCNNEHSVSEGAQRKRLGST